MLYCRCEGGTYSTRLCISPTSVLQPYSNLLASLFAYDILLFFSFLLYIVLRFVKSILLNEYEHEHEGLPNMTEHTETDRLTMTRHRVTGRPLAVVAWTL